MHVDQPELQTVSEPSEAKLGPKGAEALSEQGSSGGCDRGATTISSGGITATTPISVPNTIGDECMLNGERNSIDGEDSVTGGKKSIGYTMVQRTIADGTYSETKIGHAEKLQPPDRAEPDFNPINMRPHLVQRLSREVPITPLQ